MWTRMRWGFDETEHRSSVGVPPALGRWQGCSTSQPGWAQQGPVLAEGCFGAGCLWDEAVPELSSSRVRHFRGQRVGRAGGGDHRQGGGKSRHSLPEENLVEHKGWRGTSGPGVSQSVGGKACG